MNVYSLDPCPFCLSGSGLGALGLDAQRTAFIQDLFAKIKAKGDNCQDYLTWEETYTRLSQKDKKTSTKVAAKEMAVLCRQEYQRCLDAKAQREVDAAIAAAIPVTPTPSPTPTPVVTPLLPATTTVPVAGTLPTLTSTAPVGTAAESWFTPGRIAMIAGGVALVGLAVWLLMRRRASNPQKITVRDIEQWIDNDEGLYRWQRRSGLSKRAFIKQNRAELEQAIRNVTEGRKPAHYLWYGPY